jgi:hypothetical protein
MRHLQHHIDSNNQVESGFFSISYGRFFLKLHHARALAPPVRTKKAVLDLEVARDPTYFSIQ